MRKCLSVLCIFSAHLLTKQPNGRVLVVINPFSGQKKAENLWIKHGSYVLKAAGICADIVHTGTCASRLEDNQIENKYGFAEYPQHATKIMRELDIDRYDAVLVNSGDGLVTEVREWGKNFQSYPEIMETLHDKPVIFQVICGLLLRKDRERALKFPICHIPGGTSNALAAAICYACKYVKNFD
ncbi:unnamed protein product [Cylicostephanus goldi]|uniref:DAGKc domain-containing protein n=1 Tax=Cylicostephanus goldi TaxID=71465 RepID=A0A3P7MJH1_CYLGO|nr:unnamed protein product [Cylicostephanus goldi]